MNSYWIKLALAACVLSFAAGCSRESKVQRHLDRANQFFAKQEYDKAEIEYLNVLRLDSGNHTALRQIGLALYEQGRYPQAFAFLQRARAADTNNIEVRTKVAYGALLTRNFAQAREEALFVLSKQPTNEEALVLLADSAEGTDLDETKALIEKHRAPVAGFHVAMGLIELRTNRVAEAEANFKEAVRINPRSPPARATLANFYARQGQFELAEEQFKAAADAAPARSLLALSYADFKIKQGRREDGRKLLEALAKRVPDFLPPTIRLAELALDRKDYDGCESILKPILASGQVNFDAQFLQARLKLARGDATNAMTEFERLLGAFPTVPQLHYHIALAHLAKGNAEAAGTSLNEALRLDPNLADAVILRADLDMRKGDFTAASAALGRLVTIDPNLPQARMLLAQAHAGRGDFAAALSEYEKLAATFPKNPQLQFEIGAMHLQLKDAAAARKAFETTLALDQSHWPAFERLVSVDLATGQTARALENVQMKIGAAPTNAALQRLLGRVHLAQGQTNQAEAAMLKALELAPDDRSSQLMLANLYISTKQHQAALERLQAIIAKRPNDVGAHMVAAAIHDEMKNFSVSRDHYEKILTVHPTSVAALNNLAWIYSEEPNQRPRALELAKKARSLAPNDPVVAHTLGRLAFQTADHPWSLSLLQESARRLPDEPEVVFDLANAQLANGQLAEAQALLAKMDTASAEALHRWVSLCLQPDKAAAGDVQRILQEEPNHLAARFVNGLLQQAGADYRGAQTTFESILRDYPAFSPANKHLAQIYREHVPDDQKALDHALKARQAMPGDPAVAKTLGLVNYKRNEFRRALDLLKESLSRTNDPEAQLYIGMAHLKLGEEPQAREAFAKTVSLDGSGKFGALAKQTLEELEQTE